MDSHNLTQLMSGWLVVIDLCFVPFGVFRGSHSEIQIGSLAFDARGEGSVGSVAEGQRLAGGVELIIRMVC